MKFDRGFEAADWAVEKMTGLYEPPIFLPLAKTLLPSDSQRAEAHGGYAIDAPVRVHLLFHLIGRRTGQFVDACGVGDAGPNNFRRLGVMPFLAIVVKGFHCRIMPRARRLLYARDWSRFRDLSPGLFTVLFPSPPNPFNCTPTTDIAGIKGSSHDACFALRHGFRARPHNRR